MYPERKRRSEAQANTAPVAPEYEDTSKLSKISAVGRDSYGRNRRGSEIFIGWDGANKPTIVMGRDSLSQDALESLNQSLAADQDIQTISSDVIPVKFSISETPIDQPDKRNERTQDILRFIVSNTDGRDSIIMVKELAALDAICNPLKWNIISAPQLGDSSSVASVRTMYTVILPNAKDDSGKSYALLFEPSTTGSNERAYKRFVSQVVMSLLSIDKKQPDQGKKGYEKIAARLGIGTPDSEEDGLAFQLFSGFVDDKTKEVLRKKSKQAEGFDGQVELIQQILGLRDYDEKSTPKEEDPIVALNMEGLSDFLYRLNETIKRAF